MKKAKLADAELRFARLVWENEPVGSGELALRCAEEFGWKKSTSYTVLKNLCERGVLQNEGAVVTSRIGEEEYRRMQSERFVEETFDGSLPRFLTAFMDGKKLTPEQAAELKTLIDQYEEERRRH